MGHGLSRMETSLIRQQERPASTTGVAGFWTQLLAQSAGAGFYLI